MANGGIEKAAPFWNGWRVAGWSIPVVLLTIPAVAMRFTSEVDWDATDFIVMAALFATIGLGIEFLMRQSLNAAYRIGAVIALVTCFLTIWVNLAVGMIGSEGNPYNLLFGGVLVAALAGAITAKFKPAGMAHTMLGAAVLQALAGAGGLASDPRGGLFSIIFAAPWILASGLFRNATRATA